MGERGRREGEERKGRGGGKKEEGGREAGGGDRRPPIRSQLAVSGIILTVNYRILSTLQFS